MFWSRDFSSDDNRDPVYLHASNAATRDVRDDVEKCASAKRDLVFCMSHMIHVFSIVRRG